MRKRRKRGGPVGGPREIVVGDQGPETVIHVHVHGLMSDPKELSQRVIEWMKDYQRRNGKRFLD